MSDIGTAREFLKLAKQKIAQARELDEEASNLVINALMLMTRKPAVRHAKKIGVHITNKMRQQIVELSKDRGLTMHDIGMRVGVRNGGRVSEVLNGKR